MFRTENIIAKSKRGTERRDEIRNSGEYEEAIRRTKTPLHAHEYMPGVSQELSFVYKEYRVTIGYSDTTSADEANVSIIQKHLETSFSKENPALNGANWKKLTAFAARSPDGFSFDVLHSVPPDCPAYFCPANSEADPKGSFCSDPKALFYAGDIGTIAGMAVLAHEIGHLHNEILRPKEQQESVPFHRDADLAAKILKERYANAFALKQLRAFIKDPRDRKDVLVLLRHYGQGSYDHVLTQVNEIRNRDDERAFYDELRKLMQEEDDGSMFGPYERDWLDEEGAEHNM